LAKSDDAIWERLEAFLPPLLLGVDDSDSSD
jgi:hypothetical protein